MNRKQFLILVIALIVLGGASFALFWQDIADYRASGQKIGAKLLPSFKVADVAQLDLKDAKSKTTLQRKDSGWVVGETVFATSGREACPSTKNSLRSSGS